KVDCNAILATALQNLQASIEESGSRIERGELPTITAETSELLQLFQKPDWQCHQISRLRRAGGSHCSGESGPRMGIFDRRQWPGNRAGARRNHFRNFQTLAHSLRVSGQSNWSLNMQKNCGTARRAYLG